MCQHGIINKIVDEYNAVFSRTDNPGSQFIGIINLTIKENSLRRNSIGFKRLENLLNFVISFNLFAFYILDSLQKPAVMNNEFSHLHKSSHDPYTHLNCCFTAQYS